MGGCTLGLALWDTAGPGTNATASSASAVKTHRGEECAVTERRWFDLATTTGIATLVDISAHPRPRSTGRHARLCNSTGIKLAPSCDAFATVVDLDVRRNPAVRINFFVPYHPNAHPVEWYFRRRFEIGYLSVPTWLAIATASSRRNIAVHNGKRQTSPPAMSASGSCCRGAVPRFSMVLYHVMRAAVAVIKAMPIALIMICIPMPPDISTRMK